MELAVNLFLKGLQCDTHPMVQGNDTLSDALNATFITMNGNEVVLQNDMGNRRIDNAFLPAGYEPVGMKEYGGIIYVAAYNPITNRSLIGSFPSPERKINNLDDPSLGTNFEFSDITNNTYNETLAERFNLSFIKNDVMLYPLTSDTALHAGDKFVVYSSALWSLLSRQNYITNFNQTGKLNRLYTLFIGVLNSLNEFVDVTRTLVRWNSSGQIIDTSNMSDDIKFNTGYFIAPSFSNPYFDYTKADATLIRERQTIAANTYSYKLVGPMYLKSKLNHVSNFNYNIYGTYNNGSATLWIEGFFTYNCPNSSVDFDFYPSYSYSTIANNVSSSIYDSETDSYSAEIVKKYTGVRGNDGDLLHYVVAIPAISGSPYLRGLTTEGVIDLSLLGSGTVKLSGWRFYNDTQSTLLTFMLDAYPEYGDKFSDLKITFTDVSEEGDDFKYPYPLDVYNGRTNLSLNWEEIGLKPRHLYRVKLTCKSKNKGTINITDSKWILTTKLFNDCYDSNSGFFVRDYCDPKDEALNSDWTERQIIDDKLTITLGFSSNLVDRSYKDLEIEGSIIKKGGSDILLKYNNKHKCLLSDTPTVYIVNEELYPYYIYVKEDNKNLTKINSANVTYVGSVQKTDENEYDTIFKSPDNMSFVKYNNVDVSTETYFEVPAFTIDEFNNVTGDIIYRDIYKSIGVSPSDKEITNAFSSIKSEGVMTDLLSVFKEDPHYGCISTDFNARGGAEDGHYFRYVDGTTELGSCQGSDGDGPTQNVRSWVEIAFEERDGYYMFEMSNFFSTVNLCFSDSITNDDLVFSYRFKDTDESINQTNDRRAGILANNKARVWWRTTKNSWAVFNTLMSKSSNSSDKTASLSAFLNSVFTTDFTFCLYQNVLCSEKLIYIPDSENESFNTKYNIPITLTLTYSMDDPNAAVTNSGITSPINFTISDTFLNDTLDIVIPLESSSEFENLVSNTSELTLDCINLDNGSNKDSKGNPLDKNTIYMKDSEGNLVKWTNCPFVIRLSANRNTNLLLYNKEETTAMTQNQYDVCGWDGKDHWTLLKYNKVILIPNTI